MDDELCLIDGRDEDSLTTVGMINWKKESLIDKLLGSKGMSKGQAGSKGTSRDKQEEGGNGGTMNWKKGSLIGNLLGSKGTSRNKGRNRKKRNNRKKRKKRKKRKGGRRGRRKRKNNENGTSLKDHRPETNVKSGFYL